MYDLDRLLEFTKFTHKFQQVIRTLYITGEDRDENDAEHSFQLAILAWYIISANNLKLDIGKVLKYSIVHDLVETYAGDTFVHTADLAFKESKHRREEKALVRIKSEFSEFKEMFHVIEEYERKNDKESKFVYALDKILPQLNIYLDGGRSWHREKVSLEMLKNEKDKKVAVSNEIEKYWKQIYKLLKKNERRLFPVG